MVEIVASIRPEWIRRIFKHKKLAEIRKSMPQCIYPIKIYWYETKVGRGAVVGESICFLAAKVEHFTDVTAASCLSEWELKSYSNGKSLYAWFLAKTVEYEQPRPLSDFGLNRPPQSWCYVKRSDENGY